ncbi:MAG: tRNA (N(6)-L-threonylcarbamoyladenosine(37)-C(2))-methylthiotransferase [Candidatus Asgardarchaeia archaeon]
MTSKVFIKTYGCALNKSDTEIMGGILERAGYSIVDDIDEAEVVIVNTCGVKDPTEHRVLHYLRRLSNLDKKVIVAGCLPKMCLERVKKAIPNFSAIIGPYQIYEIDKIVKRSLMGDRFVKISEDFKIGKFPRHYLSNLIGIIPIAYGCLGRCTYCSVKFARGRLKSRPLDLIVEELKEMVKRGFKEIWLTAQDTGVYGRDLGYNLVDLMEECRNVKGKFFIRIGMMTPNSLNEMLEEFLDVFKDDKFYKFLHIPVQSGSNRILKMMGRRYTVEEFINISKRVRESIPMVSIATDIIVGFPSESLEDFKESIRLVEEIKPDVVNISRYGDRPGAESSKFEGKIPTHVKVERSRIMSKVIDRVAYERNRSWLGWSGEVLITEYGSRGSFICRNFAYKPIVIKRGGGLEMGDTVKVRVVDVRPHFLIGSLEEV